MALERVWRKACEHTHTKHTTPRKLFIVHPPWARCECALTGVQLEQQFDGVVVQMAAVEDDLDEGRQATLPCRCHRHRARHVQRTEHWEEGKNTQLTKTITKSISDNISDDTHHTSDYPLACCDVKVFIWDGKHMYLNGNNPFNSVYVGMISTIQVYLFLSAWNDLLYVEGSSMPPNNNFP